VPDSPNDPDDRERQLAAWVDEAVRHMPMRRAPASLEVRVLDDIRRASRQAGWRRGFMHWSASIRAAFVIASLAAMVTLLWMGVGNVGDAESGVFAWLQPGMAAITLAGELTMRLGALIPTTWLYAVVGAGGLLYAALFGLGATAYRTLYLPRLNDRYPA
jgi:hypothetical protein